MMAYCRSVMFQYGYESLTKTRQFRNKIDEYKRYMSVARKVVSRIEVDNVSNHVSLNQNSKLHLGEEKPRSVETLATETTLRPDVDIYNLVEEEMKDFFRDIRNELKSRTRYPEMLTMASYYLDGKGKAIRPTMALLMSKSLNFHINNGRSSTVRPQVRHLAMITEMIHSASLMHDDLLDGEEFRRGKASMISLNQKKVASAGDFVIGTVIAMIERLQNYEARIILYEMIRDLTVGEFLQLDEVKAGNEDMLSRYLNITHLKAATLFSKPCEAVAVMAGASYFLQEAALNYGKNIGMAFQLADDYKDFESDLRRGVVTAPVILVCKKHPELEEVIRRRFAQQGDLERTFDLVHKAQGLKETKDLVQRYCDQATRHAALIRESRYQNGLQEISRKILDLISE